MKEKNKISNNNYKHFSFYIFPNLNSFSKNPSYLKNLKKDELFYKITGKEDRFSKIKEKIGLSEKQETKRFVDYIINNFNPSEVKTELDRMVKYKNLELITYRIKN